MLTITFGPTTIARQLDKWMLEIEMPNMQLTISEFQDTGEHNHRSRRPNHQPE